jgi:polar amino acid transport system substrate-binding protein
MKKLSIILSALILASLVLTACAPKAKTVVVAVENAYPPFNMIDEATGEGVGWDYDTVREICKRISCVPEFKEAAWDVVFELG